MTTEGCHDRVPRAMCKIQNVARADGLYYYRRLIRLGRD